MKYCLAFDIGASSGRAILGHREQGELQIEEIYRFSTPFVDEGSGHCHWDADILFSHLLASLKKAKEIGKIPEAVGIDSFGVDYALLDQRGRIIGDVVSYRDVRGSIQKEKFSTPDEVFALTGVSPQSFDSLYQLAADQESGKLQKASSLLFLPCYLSYLLTGRKVTELSIASTSALLNAADLSYVPPFLKSLGLKPSFFPPLVEAGYVLGPLKKEIAREVGYQCEVRMALGHDTASAFYGSGAGQDEVLLSSGTWSLIGCLLPQPIITEEANRCGFTNELSFCHQVRFLKNISGMFIINTLKKELGLDSFDLITSKARAGSSYEGVFDPSDPTLLNPPKMKEAIFALFLAKGYPLPKTDGELLYSVYRSLALSYALAIKELERLTGKRFTAIRIFGGGVQASLLNELTERCSGLPVNKGPSEATALGNLLSIEGHEEE